MQNFFEQGYRDVLEKLGMPMVTDAQRTANQTRVQSAMKRTGPQPEWGTPEYEPWRLKTKALINKTGGVAGPIPQGPATVQGPAGPGLGSKVWGAVKNMASDAVNPDGGTRGLQRRIRQLKVPGLGGPNSYGGHGNI